MVLVDIRTLKNGGLKMADHQNVKIYLILTKIGTRGLSKFLIIQNSKWRI